MTAPAPRVEVTIVMQAPHEQVFDAWLTPDRMARFLCAGDTRVTQLEADPRVGGSFRVVMADDRGTDDHRGAISRSSGRHGCVSPGHVRRLSKRTLR